MPFVFIHKSAKVWYYVNVWRPARWANCIFPVDHCEPAPSNFTFGRGVRGAGSAQPPPCPSPLPANRQRSGTMSMSGARPGGQTVCFTTIRSRTPLTNIRTSLRSDLAPRPSPSLTFVFLYHVNVWRPARWVICMFQVVHCEAARSNFTFGRGVRAARSPQRALRFYPQIGKGLVLCQCRTPPGQVGKLDVSGGSLRARWQQLYIWASGEGARSKSAKVGYFVKCLAPGQVGKLDVSR